MSSGARIAEQRLYGSTQLRLVDVEKTKKNGLATGFEFMEGRAVPYGTFTPIRGYYLEEIRFGAADKSIDESARALPLLLWHDNRTWPIGRSERWDSSVDALDGVWRLDNSAEAQRAAQLADKGMLNGMSIGFVPIRAEWEFVDEWAPSKGPQYMDRCSRLEIRLAEVSVVPAGAYEDAEVTLVRSADWGRQDQAPGRRRLGTPRLDEWRNTLADLTR